MGVQRWKPRLTANSAIEENSINEFTIGRVRELRRDSILVPFRPESSASSSSRCFLFLCQKIELYRLNSVRPLCPVLKNFWRRCPGIVSRSQQPAAPGPKHPNSCPFVGASVSQPATTQKGLCTARKHSGPVDATTDFLDYSSARSEESQADLAYTTKPSGLPR